MNDRRPNTLYVLVIFVLVLAAGGAALTGGQALDISKQTIVDLSHAYGPSTVFWPTSPYFTKIELEVELADGHHHVPLLVSPYGCATYRGS